MKKLVNIFAALSALVLLAVSCTEEAPYKPAEKPSGAQIYFAYENPTAVSLSNKATTFSVALGRQNTQGSVTVTVVPSGEGVSNFEIPSTVTFAEGSATADLVITYDVNKIGYDNPQPLTLTIAASEMTTPYGYDSYSFTATIPAPWIVFAKAHVTEGWWGEEEDETIYYQDLENGMRKCYISDCFDTGGGAMPVDFTFYWNTVTNAIDVPKQYLGVDYADWEPKPESEATNPIYVYDWYNFFTTDGGYTPAQLGDADNFYKKNGANYPRSYYDGNGGFFFNQRYYIPGLGGWTPDKFDMFAICEGFVRKDYTITVAYGGMTVYNTGLCLPFIDFLADAPDVVNVKWMLTDQTVDPVETLATIVEGTSEEINTTKMDNCYAREELEVEVGLYRLVAVPQGDEDELSEDDAVFIDFYFPGAQQDIPEVEATVIAVDVDRVLTPEQIEQYGCTTYNSFGWGMIGKEITAGGYYINKSEVVATWKGDLGDLVKTYGKAFTAAQLTKVNGSGYVNASINLSADTEYSVVAYFENVYGATKTLVATYKTSAIPYSGSLKVGTYTMSCTYVDEETGESADFENTFELEPTTDDNTFLVTDFGLEDGSSWYAKYDEDAKTLTLDGTVYGYEDEGNLFGVPYGYFDAEKTYVYGFWSASIEGGGETINDPCVLTVSGGYITGLKGALIVMIYAKMEGQFVPFLPYRVFDPTATFVYGDAAASSQTSWSCPSKSFSLENLGVKAVAAPSVRVPFSPFAPVQSIEGAKCDINAVATKTIGEKKFGQSVKANSCNKHSQFSNEQIAL